MRPRMATETQEVIVLKKVLLVAVVGVFTLGCRVDLVLGTLRLADAAVDAADTDASEGGDIADD